MPLSLQIQIPHRSGRDSAISLQSQVQTARCREGDNDDNNNVPAYPCIRANAGKAARDHSRTRTTGLDIRQQVAPDPICCSHTRSVVAQFNFDRADDT